MKIYIKRSRIRNDLFDIRLFSERTTGRDARVHKNLTWPQAVLKYFEMTGEANPELISG